MNGNETSEKADPYGSPACLSLTLSDSSPFTRKAGFSVRAECIKPSFRVLRLGVIYLPAVMELEHSV
jgi:hypothetical protein